MKRYQGKKVLITGGAGFIGSALARQLVATGASVTIVDSLIAEYGGNLFNLRDIRDQVNLNIADVRDPYAMAYHVKDKEFLFNLAGQTSHIDSMTDPLTDLNINAAAQLSILEACRKHNPDIRIVFASTRQLYGRPRYLPVDEKHPIIPVDINGVNKLAGECYHRLYNDVHGIRACALRLTNTYGPGMRVKDARQTFLGYWIRNLTEDRPIEVFGDGTQVRDFNYVDDAVSALLLAGMNQSVAGKVFNLGSPERISLLDLANLMISILGKGQCRIVPFPPERRVIDIGDYYGEFSLFNSATGWSPTTALSEGLRKSLFFYQQHLGKYL